MYTPLYVKSNYSFMSSLVRIDKLIKYCLDNSIKSIALCDDNMISTMLFYKECLANNIKPIISLEVKVEEKPILLYAKNNLGYKNLIKIATIYSEGKIDFDVLANYLKNLIVILPFESKDLFLRLNKVLNEEDLYIGFSNREEEKELSIENRVFLNKVLYITRKESKYLKYAIMMREKKNVLDNIEYKDNDNYIIDENRAASLSSDIGLANTTKIATLCNVEFSKQESYIPTYENNLGLPSEEYLTKLSIQGLTMRLNGNVEEKYKKRLLYELDIIKKMGFADYFLIVYDYVKYAKKNKILVGPGRGSAGGSLVAFSLGIIDVDPIKYDLLFERFLNPGRKTMPDIDIDFPDIYRDEVINYTREKYGIKKVAGIVAIGTLKAKAVLDDVARVLKVSQEKVDRLKKYIDLNSKLEDIYKNNYEFKNIVDNDERLALLYEISLYFEGFPKNTTVHASGIIISKVELDEVIPLIKQDGVYVSSYEMAYLEELGLLKMDFLGNRNLTTIMEILDKIKEYENKDIDFLNIPLDDNDTLKMFYDVDTNGIFQFESDTMKHLLARLKVTSFNDIVAADALVRPGPDTEGYIARKNGIEKINYLNSEVKNVLEPTYGIMVYQEQIMQIANVLAGYSLAEADILRRAMSKKKKDILKIEEEKFIKGAIKNGYNYDVAKSYYDDILSFAQYGFNKSHAVAYSIVSYKMAYLKVHYPKYFYLSLLSMIIGNEYKTSQIIREARAKNVTFLLPDIKKSTEKYEIVKEGILFPLSNIKNIGLITAREIVRLRENGFKDIFDCLTKLVEGGINRRNIETLIYASTMDCFGYNKNTLISNLDNLLTYAFIAKGLESDIIEHPVIETKEEFSNDILMEKEKELFGFYLRNHPVTKYKSKYKVTDLNNAQKFIDRTIDTIILVEKIKKHIDKNGNYMAFISGSDEISTMEYTLFSNVYETVKDIDKGNVVLLRGKVQKREKINIIVEKAKIID